MTDPVFLVPDLAAQLDAVGETGAFVLPDAEARHASVKRIREGEAVVLTDGAGLGVAGQWAVDGRVTGSAVLDAASHRPGDRGQAIEVGTSRWPGPRQAGATG